MRGCARAAAAQIGAAASGPPTCISGLSFGMGRTSRSLGAAAAELLNRGEGVWCALLLRPLLLGGARCGGTAAGVAAADPADHACHAHPDSKALRTNNWDQTLLAESIAGEAVCVLIRLRTALLAQMHNFIL